LKKTKSAPSTGEIETCPHLRRVLDAEETRKPFLGKQANGTGVWIREPESAEDEIT